MTKNRSIPHPGPALDTRSAGKLDETLKRYCLALTGSRPEAEDLAQDAWLKALANQGPALQHANPEALLLRIARNAWIDRSRKRDVVARLAVQEQIRFAAAAAHDAPETAFAIESVFQSLVRHLSRTQLAVFLLREACGFSIAETAGLLATTEGAVKAALHRARRALEAVRSDLATGGLPQPSGESEQSLLHALAAAYLGGSVARLLQLTGQSAAPAVALAAAVGYALESRSSSAPASLRRSGPGTQTGPRSAAALSFLLAS